MTAPAPLTVEDCAALLRAGELGRVAMATPVGPRIVPVNYAVHDASIVFRTTPYSELSTYGWNTDLAFEVDHVDPATHLGWSVVALGRAHIVEDPRAIREIRSTWDPDPWASGVRNLYVKLVWRDLRGVRLGALATSSA
jgi:nitroimidazol reductase NimA-like FMN-containing flavoprotein (pyridoxamine 5'-phosphate oxidase superfamily)